MDPKVFCQKVADALGVPLKWYTKDDLRRCVNFTPNLNEPIVLNQKGNNITLSFDLCEFGGSINANIYKADTDNWYILSMYKDGTFSLQENLPDGDIDFIIDSKRLNTCIKSLLTELSK